MALFSRTQIPKYQSPIRITRPYIKPNYLADTINSAIQGYGSIQNTNMQRQLFNAKLAQQQKQQAQQELDQVTYRQMFSNTAPTQQLEMFYEGQDPLMGGGPAMGPQSEMTTQPGMSQMESIMAAMQSNPGARIQDIMAMAGGINTLQNPNKTGGLTASQLLTNQYRTSQAAIAAEREAYNRRWNEEGRAMTEAKNAQLAEVRTGKLQTQRSNAINNFELLFDKEVGKWIGLHDWDTPNTSGGWDKSGLEALEAFGATTSNPEWVAMRQKAGELYMLRRSLKHDESTIMTDIYKLAKQALVPDSDGISHRVEPNKVVAIMQAQIDNLSGNSRLGDLGLR